MTFISMSTGNISQGTAVDAHASVGTPGYTASGHGYIQADMYGHTGQGVYGSEDFGYNVGPPSAGLDIIGYIYGGEIDGCWDEKLKQAKKPKPHPDMKIASPGQHVPGTAPVRQN